MDDLNSKDARSRFANFASEMAVSERGLFERFSFAYSTQIEPLHDDELSDELKKLRREISKKNQDKKLTVDDIKKYTEKIINNSYFSTEA